MTFRWWGHSQSRWDVSSQRDSPVPTLVLTPQGPTLAFLLQAHSPPVHHNSLLLWGPKVCRGSTLAVTLHRSSNLLDVSVSTGGGGRKTRLMVRRMQSPAEKGAK